MNNSIKAIKEPSTLKEKCSKECECYNCVMSRLAEHQANIDSQIKDNLFSN